MNFPHINELLTQKRIKDLFLELEKRLIIITGDRGTGKTAIALRLMELFYPTSLLTDCLSFDELIIEQDGKQISFMTTTRFSFSDLDILVYPSLDMVSPAHLSQIGLWINALYIDRSERISYFEILELSQVKGLFMKVQKNAVQCFFPSDSLYQDYRSILKKCLARDGDSLMLKRRKKRQLSGFFDKCQCIDSTLILRHGNWYCVKCHKKSC